MYAIAFLIAFKQNFQLIGKNGLTPFNKYMKNIEPRILNDGSKTLSKYPNLKLFLKCPTLLWFVNWRQDGDTFLDLISFTGILSWITIYIRFLIEILIFSLSEGLSISGFVILTGRANVFILTTLWLLYHSIVNVGQTWYSFGRFNFFYFRSEYLVIFIKDGKVSSLKVDLLEFSWCHFSR